MVNKHAQSIEDQEKKFFMSIKNEIDSMVDIKLHAFYKSDSNGKSDIKKIEKECSDQFFRDLEKIFDDSVKNCEAFYQQLKLDDRALYKSIKKEMEPILSKIQICKSFKDLVDLKESHLSEGTHNEIKEIGLKHFKNGHFDKAYLYFTFLSLADAESPQVWLVRGMVEQNLGKYEQALNSYSAALTLAPEHLITYLQIIDTLLLMKRFDEALHTYEIFMREINPEHYAHNPFVISKLTTIRSFLPQLTSKA